MRRDGFALGPIDLALDYGDRVAITGPIGAGNSTLLGLFLGRIAPDEGRVDGGSRVVIGEIDQARAAFEGPRDARAPLRARDARLAGCRGAHAPREVRAQERPRRPPRRWHVENGRVEEIEAW